MIRFRQSNNLPLIEKIRITRRVQGIFILIILLIALILSIFGFLIISIKNHNDLDKMLMEYPLLLDDNYTYNWTFSNNAEITDYIHHIANNTGKPDYVIAWELVSNLMVHEWAIWNDWSLNPPYDWQHSPALMLNSLGFGICDDAASVLHAIWLGLGYQARVWGVTGHTVSEVYVNDSWHMYDADMKVYYYTPDLQIASVSDLIANNSLVDSPINPILDLTAPAYHIGYVYVFGIVATDYTIWLPPEVPKFQIPLNAVLSVIHNLTIDTIDHSQFTTNGLQIDLPASWNGSIAEPLILHSVVGNYTSVNTTSGKFIQSITLYAISNVTLIYLLNPNIRSLNQLIYNFDI